jgi:indolepyruvate ferredoxin oxidoreductase beta subunit
MELKKAQNIIIAGVGGQGAVTIAQLVLGAAWRSNYYVLQSEVHGMSQRGGEVNAQIIFDSKPVTGPVVGEGEGDLLIGLEPLETLRYVKYLSENAKIISSNAPIVNMAGYPEDQELIYELERLDAQILNTTQIARELKNMHAGNMAVLGAAAVHMPIEKDLWAKIIEERFAVKGDRIIQKNIEAFNYGYNLK